MTEIKPTIVDSNKIVEKLINDGDLRDGEHYEDYEVAEDDDLGFYQQACELLLKQRDDLKTENAELEERLKRWQSPSLTLLIPSAEDPFRSYKCLIADVGHSEYSFSVNCPELTEAIR